MLPLVRVIVYNKNVMEKEKRGNKQLPRPIEGCIVRRSIGFQSRKTP